MDGTALLGGPGGVGGRAHQRMAEQHPSADLEQLLGLRPGRRIRSETERLRCPPQQSGVPGGVGGRQQHQLPGRCRQPPDASQVVVLQLTRQGPDLRQREATEQLRLADAPGDLQQRQRVPAGLCHQSVTDPLIQVARNTPPLSDPNVVDRLGADLRTAGYDAVTVPDLLGRSAHRALGRGELAPALRATRDGSELSTLIRLFLLGATEDERAVGAAFGHTGIADAVRTGALEPSGNGFRAALDIRPYSADAQEYLLVSDLDSDTRPGPVRPDHVLGLGAASITLARAVVRQPVQRALDLGTGSGIQALHLAAHAAEVVATDTNSRALALAAATARLNGQQWDLRAGSLFEPVADDAFDLIVCNPPFVIGDGEQRFSYRDSGVAGDGLCRALIGGIPPTCVPAAPPSCWPTGSSGRAPTGANGSAAGCRAPAATHGWCSANWPTRPNMSGSGSVMPARTLRPERAAPGPIGPGLTELRPPRSRNAGSTTSPRRTSSGIGMGLITLQRNDSR